MKRGYGHFKNFLKTGLKAKRNIGGSVTVLFGFINYSIMGAIFKMKSAKRELLSNF
jgi:hypothetical protein